MSHLAPATARGRTRRQNGIGRTIAEELPSFDDMRTNLLQTIAEATADDETAGLGWYHAAHMIAEDIAAAHGLTIRQAAGLLAALSPQTGWAENVRLAVQAAESGRASDHFADACEKADRILRGEDPAEVLGGRKVRSFFTNIADPTRSGAVTVDRHCVDMLAGSRGYVQSRILERVGAYALCAAVVRSVARELNLRPHEVQAIAWVAWRNAHEVPAHHDF